MAFSPNLFVAPKILSWHYQFGLPYNFPSHLDLERKFSCFKAPLRLASIVPKSWR